MQLSEILIKPLKAYMSEDFAKQIAVAIESENMAMDEAKSSPMKRADQNFTAATVLTLLARAQELTVESCLEATKACLLAYRNAK